MVKKVRYMNFLVVSLLALFLVVSCGNESNKKNTGGTSAKQSFEKGNAYYKLGKIDEAIKEYENTVLYDRQHKMAHYNLAVLYKEKHRYSEAVHEYEEYLKYEKGTDEKSEKIKKYVESEIKVLREKAK